MVSRMSESTRVTDHATLLAELREQVKTLDARIDQLGRHL
jgi:hypothetical protein